MGPRGPELNRHKVHNFFRIMSASVKLWYHMFSTPKVEDYMKTELSGIFRVKLSAKNTKIFM